MIQEKAAVAVTIALISKKNKSTSEKFGEIFQLIKDDITKENAKMGELIPPRL